MGAFWNVKLQQPRILNQAQIDSVLGIGDPEWRGAAMVVQSTGRTLPEVARLRCRDIDHEANLIHFYNQKLGSSVKVHIAGPVSEQLACFKNHHDPNAPLFPNLFKTAQSNPTLLKRRFNRMQQKAGLRPRSFCSLRKTFITQMTSMGVPIALVGHVAGCHTKTVMRHVRG